MPVTGPVTGCFLSWSHCQQVRQRFIERFALRFSVLVLCQIERVDGEHFSFFGFIRLMLHGKSAEGIDGIEGFTMQLTFWPESTPPHASTFGRHQKRMLGSVVVGGRIMKRWCVVHRANRTK